LEAGLEDEMNDKKAETPVSCVSQTGKAKSAPHHRLGIDLGAALAAYRIGHCDLAILAQGANVGIEQQLDIFSHCRTAMGAGLVLELEIPDFPALGAAVVRYNLDFTVSNVFLESAVSPGAVRVGLRKASQPHLQHWQMLFPLPVEDLDVDLQGDEARH
jgi:hypothetical protein